MTKTKEKQEPEPELRYAGLKVIDEFGIPLTELVFTDITAAKEFIHNYCEIIVKDKMCRYWGKNEDRLETEQIIRESIEDYYDIIKIYRRKQGEAEENDIYK